MPSESICYSKSKIVEIINNTTLKHINNIITSILNEYVAFLKSPAAVGANCWEFFFECEYVYMQTLNTEIQKHFDSSVFVRIYGGGAGTTSNKLICRVNWGAD